MCTQQTMKIKLIKETVLNDQTIPAGHILEIEDEAGQQLITDESAVLYTPEMEQMEETEIIQEEVENLKAVEKTVKTQTKSIHDYAKGNKKMEKTFAFGEKIKQALDTKAVTSFASTEATPVLGNIFEGSKIFSKTNKRNINGNLNVVFLGALSGSGIGPAIDIVAEATAASTSVPLMQYNAIPGKYFATVPVPNEYMEDVQGMETSVSNAMNKQINYKLDAGILGGAFTNSTGLKGVIGDANAVKQTVASVTAWTKDEIEAQIAKVLPEAQANAMWVVSPVYWAAAQGALLDADNVGGQLIKDGAEKSLYGYPVVVSTAIPSANPAVFGDFGEYVVGVARDIAIEPDRSAGFTTDSTIIRASVRVAGGLASSPKYYAGSTYGVMTYAGLSA